MLAERDGGQRAAVSQRVGRALLALGVVVSLGSTVVLGRVVQLQVLPGERLAGFMDERVSRRMELARRGDLLDRQGRVLATTRGGFRLFVDPTELEAPFGTAISAAARITGLDEDVLAGRIISRVERNAHRARDGRSLIRYVSIGSVLSAEQEAIARQLNVKGFHLERRRVRETPGAELAAPLLGLVGVDHVGRIGAEKWREDRLAPRNGQLDYVRDARGRAMWVEASGYVPAQSGEDVRLSIDLELQQIAVEELQRGIENADAAGGRLVMVEPGSGEVLALVDLVRDVGGLTEPPTRDEPGQKELPRGRYRTIAPDPNRDALPALARNRCVEDVYEPGSTFKPFMWSVVTQRGLAAPDEVFDTHDGRWVTPFGRVIEDVHKRAQMTWAEVLVNSSNIGMVQGTARLTHGQMRAGVLLFAFGSKTRLGLAGESAGLVTPLKRWSTYTQSSVASGYEVGVTPVQMVRAFCVFARTGELAGTLPELALEAVRNGDVRSSVRVRVLEPGIAELAKEQMRKVAQNMSDRIERADPEAGALRYTMFGKSGTAEIARPDGRGYYDDQYNSSFIAGAPIETPRIVVLVVIDDPGPSMIAQRRHYGSWAAGPVVRRVVERSLEYLGVAGDVGGNLE